MSTLNEELEGFLQEKYEEIENTEILGWHHFCNFFLKALKQPKTDFAIDIETLTIALAEQAETCFEDRGRLGCRERERVVYKKICDFFEDYRSKRVASRRL